MPVLRPTRRDLLAGALAGAGLAAAGGWPRRAHAAVGRSDLRFVFVRIFGGWDTTRVFATDLGNRNVDYEERVQLGQVGDLPFIDHPDRPGVRTFFERWGDRTVVFNGLVVPSVNHRICERLALTGGNQESAADWPTRIAHAQADRYGLPHVVAGGRSIPGQLGGSVVRIGDNGQVGQMLDGSILDHSDLPAQSPPADLRALLDQSVADAAADRAAQVTDARRKSIIAEYGRSLERAATMKDQVDEVRWQTDGTFASQIEVCADLLELGLSRCVTLSFERLTWDSHEDNTSKQHANFKDLFDGLALLMETLGATPGVVGDTLADETVVVVVSEMGRTPQENSAKGKDHWAHTSSMLVGPGLDGGRAIGGYDELFYGQHVDPASGERASGGRELLPALFGATLLELGDVGPVEGLPEYTPITGALA